MAQQFGNLTASAIYCPKCKTAQPVRERLLLVLPTGELYDFSCRTCGTSLAKRTVAGPAVTSARALRSASGPRPARRLLR